MTNQFELFGGNQMVPTIVNTSSHQIESNNCIRSQPCISDSALYHICMEPTLLKLDMDDFINTLEHEYYTCQKNGENLQSLVTTTCATSPSKVPSPITPKFKCKWANTLSNGSSLPEIEIQSIAEQNSLQSSSNVINRITSNSSNTRRNKEITKKAKSKTKIQKKRNYQQVFHTIPPRNSCSEKKTGSWKFHLMDAEEEEDQSNYKFHIYSGNNSNKSNRSNNSNNSK